MTVGITLIYSLFGPYGTKFERCAFGGGGLLSFCVDMMMEVNLVKLYDQVKCQSNYTCWG